MEAPGPASSNPADACGRPPGGADVASARLQRQILLADNMVSGLAPYLEGTHAGLTLRTHQHPAMQGLHDIITDTRLHPEERRILWPAPPNAGKTTLSALIAKAAGIGDETPHGGPLKGMLLVSRDNARDDALATYARVAPGIQVLPFKPSHGPEAIDKTDLVVATYAGFSALSAEARDYMSARTDLLILDEVHRAIGPLAAANFNEIMGKYMPTMIGLSATPRFTQEHNVKDALGIKHVLPSMTPREAAETGVSNGVRLLAVHTGATLVLKTRRIFAGEISPLADDARRNRLIIKIAANMASLARPGLTQCVPGIPPSGTRHVDMLAEHAARQTVADPRTGELRPLRLEPVGVHHRGSKRTIKAFREGELDGLLFSRVLSESLDIETGLGYLIAATPSGSAVEMAQFVGRGARHYEHITTIFWLCDNLGRHASRKLVSPFTVFGETSRQGETIGRPRGASSGAGKSSGAKQPPSKPGQASETSCHASSEHLSYLVDDEVAAAINGIPAGIILRDMLISQEVYFEPPDSYTELSQHLVITGKKITAEGAAYHLQNQVGADGRPLMVTVQDSHRHRFISPEGSAMLYELFAFGPSVTRTQMQNFLNEQRWPYISNDGLFSLSEQIGVEHKLMKREIRFSPSDMHRLLQEIARVPLVDPAKEVLVADLAAALGDQTSSTILNKLKSPSGERFRQYLLDRRRGRQPGAYQVVKAMTVEGAVNFAEHRLESGPTTRARTGGMDASTLVARVQAEYRHYQKEVDLGVTLDLQAVRKFILAMSRVTAEQATPIPDVTIAPAVPLKGSVPADGQEPSSPS